ncbi:CDP-alcohol phosphatidyltransferase family protein [Candidatus Uhrbacteria bacterium]|nr:CDP-alcohol phosphatidyltransferase family protein [Candidatus Uhrbacteria bacterium]
MMEAPVPRITPFDRLTTPESERPIRTFVDYVLPRWVTPNHVSFLRLGLVPIVVACSAVGWWGAACAIFISAMLLDLVDGPLARVRGQVTTLGAALDPVVDKAAVFIPFWTWWMLVRTEGGIATTLVAAVSVLTCIEVALLAIRLRALVTPSRATAPVSANGAGKVKVWFEGFMVGFLLYEPTEELTQGIALALCTISLGLAVWSAHLHRSARRKFSLVRL